MYDAIIIGGSFAGLAVAMQLRGYRVLLIDQHPIGTHQMSACGAPLATIRAVGAARAIQEIHDALVLHVGTQTIRLPLPDPYVTFDYRAFCAAMLAQTDAEVRLERATALSAGAVTTDRGQEHTRFVVDATGWRALHAGYGIETELLVRLNIDPGLHFYFEKRIIRNGYAWIFPCGETTRFGVGAFEQGARLAPLLAQFLERFGLRRARRMAAYWRSSGVILWRMTSLSPATRPASACRLPAKASVRRSVTAFTAAERSPPLCVASFRSKQPAPATGNKCAARIASTAGC